MGNCRTDHLCHRMTSLALTQTGFRFHLLVIDSAGTREQGFWPPEN